MIEYTKDGTTYELRNLEEQVQNNLERLTDLENTGLLLSQLGIKVVGKVTSIAGLPDASTYIASGGSYGDAYAVGSSTPYYFYIMTRPFSGESSDHWFSIGKFPLAGPQGETGPAGAADLSNTKGYTITNNYIGTSGSVALSQPITVHAKVTVKQNTGTDVVCAQSNTSITYPIAFDNLSIKGTLKSDDTHGQYWYMTSPLYVHQIEIDLGSQYDYASTGVNFTFLSHRATSFGSGQSGLTTFLSYLNSNIPTSTIMWCSGYDQDYDGNVTAMYNQITLNKTSLTLMGYDHGTAENPFFTSTSKAITASSFDWEASNTYFGDEVRSYLNLGY